jgi:hypothetical protein
MQYEGNCDDSVIDELWDTLEKDAELDRKYRPTLEQRQASRKAHEELCSIRIAFEENMLPKRNRQLNMDQAKVLEYPLAAIAEAERAENEWINAKDRAWIDHLKSQTREDLKKLGRLEADRLLAKQIEDEVKREDKAMVADRLKNNEDSLKKKRPVLSLSSEWRKRKLETKRIKVEASMVSTCLERIEQRLQDQGLEVQYAARTLITAFRRDH